MNHRRLAIGPGAASLILVIVVLCMTTMGILSLRSAQSDEQLSRRSIQVAEEIYQLNSAAERTLAQLDTLLKECAAQAADDAAYRQLIEASIPAGMTYENDQIRWQETGHGRLLSCAAAVAMLDEKPSLRWTAHELRINDEEMGMDDGWN